MKKLLVIYALAVVLVLVYFALSFVFPQEKTLELKHFDTKTEAVVKIQKETEEPDKKEALTQQRFMLLPQK